MVDETQSIRTVLDLVCGTSTGGILAMALVATDMPLTEINALYKRLPSEVFTGCVDDAARVTDHSSACTFVYRFVGTRSREQRRPYSSVQ